MSKRLSESPIATRSARRSLKPGLYWRAIDPDVHLGYRKGKRGGKWLVRWYGGEQNYSQQTFATADDVLSEGTLTFDEAVKASREVVEASRRAAASDAIESLTIESSLKQYIAVRNARETARKGRSVNSDAASRLTKHALCKEDFIGISLFELKESDLLKWVRELDVKLRPTTKRRLLNDVKAALNRSYSEHRKALPPDFDKTVKFGLSSDGIPTDSASTGVRENQILSDEVVRRLVSACFEADESGDFGRLVLLLAVTGARFSQLSRMLVEDVQIDRSRLLVPQSFKGKKESFDRTPVPVGVDVIEALRPAIEARRPEEALLERWRKKQVGPMKWVNASRGPWTSSAEMTRPWNEVVDTLGMAGIVPYALRHSSIVRGIKAGLPIRLVAATHDTSVQMIERHYSRWIADGLEELSARAMIKIS